MAHQVKKNSKGSLAVCIIVENMPVPADRRVWQEALAAWPVSYCVYGVMAHCSPLQRLQKLSVLTDIEFAWILLQHKGKWAGASGRAPDTSGYWTVTDR